MSPGVPFRESKTFCILPWMHLTVMPEGSTQLCCVASSSIKAGGVPLSLQSHSLEAIWNSLHLRNVRRDMLAGRHVADCSHCYLKEKRGGTSRRQEANTRWAGELGPLFDALVEESVHRHYEVAQLPLYYQLMPGNLCNLKCRMCFPHFSSQIERDPVHRSWFPAPSLAVLGEEPASLDWTTGCVTLAPQDVAGVTLDGFHHLEKIDGQPFRWTGGNATLTLPLPRGIQPRSVRLTLRSMSWRGLLSARRRLRVLVNGTLLHDGGVPRWGRTQLTFALPHEADCSLLMVQLQGDTFRRAGDPRHLGVAVERVELLHTGEAQPDRLPSGPWYRDDDWVREVLFENADRLRGLYFTGGEPMVEKQVENVLRHLVDRQAARHIVLELNSNCTVLRETTLQLLQHFQEVRLGLSVDAVGPCYEYIRYPARWAVVRRNVEALAALSSERFKVFGGIVLQVYNALALTEILAFFDTLGIPSTIHLATWPAFLNVAVLPARIRALAADRLRTYAEQQTRPPQREHLLSVVQQIETIKDQCTPDAVRSLMQFTNDLDGSRRQNVREVHGELLALLHSEGFAWSDERSNQDAA
jgi:glutamate-1-semialdehyde 2,1-aminomutase